MASKKTILAVFLIISNGFLTWKLYDSINHNKKASLLINKITAELTEKKMLIEELRLTESLQFLNQYNTQFVDSVIMNNKVGNRPLLVLRFSVLSCHDCVDAMLTLIKSLPDSFKSNILIVTDHNAKRDLYVKLQNSDLDQVKYLVSPTIPFNFDESHRPYFFVVNNDMSISSFFIPIISNRERTVQYLEFVTNKLFNP